MKRSPIRKVSKQPISVIQRRLWQLCRELADTLYNAPGGSPRCFTCDRCISGSNKQLGHFIAKAACGAYLKYDMRNLRWQCYNCNIHLGGNGAEFYRRLVEQEGQEYMKAYDHYVQLITEYQAKLKTP